jgi:hypothetical protein
MKKTILTYLAILLLTTSCHQSTVRQYREQQRLDSIAEAKQKEIERIEKARQDSIINVEQEKVIGDIKFGMKKIEVNQKISKFKSETARPYEIVGTTFYDYYIGEYKYFQILDFYYQTKLYEIFIQGNPINWEKFENEIQKQINFISEVIKQKYGPPTFQKILDPIYNLQKGYSYLINRWEIGVKTIEIQVEDNGTYYCVNLVIYQPEIINRLNKEKEEKEKKSTEKAKNLF